MKLTKFSDEDYMQYGDVNENGTEVAMITENVCKDNEEREIIIDSDGFHIFAINTDTMVQYYLSVQCSYIAAGQMILALPNVCIFDFKLEEI